MRNNKKNKPIRNSFFVIKSAGPEKKMFDTGPMVKYLTQFIDENGKLTTEVKTTFKKVTNSIRYQNGANLDALNILYNIFDNVLEGLENGKRYRELQRKEAELAEEMIEYDLAISKLMETIDKNRVKFPKDYPIEKKINIIKDLTKV